MVDIDVLIGRYVAYSLLRYYDLTIITCPFLKYIKTTHAHPVFSVHSNFKAVAIFRETWLVWS